MSLTVDESQPPRMLFDLVFFVPHCEKVTPGGLLIPDSAKQSYAMVTALGPDCSIVKLGDIVLANTDKLATIVYNGTPAGICHEHEIAMVIPVREAGTIIHAGNH